MRSMCARVCQDGTRSAGVATAHATAGGSATREWAALDAERLITLAPRDAAAPAPPAGANDKHLIFSTVNG